MTVYRVISQSAFNSVLRGRSTLVFCGTQCHFPLSIPHCPDVQKSTPALIHSKISAGQTNVRSVKYFKGERTCTNSRGFTDKLKHRNNKCKRFLRGVSQGPKTHRFQHLALMITVLTSTASGLILIKLHNQCSSLNLPRALASFATHNLVLPGFFAQYSLIFFLLLQLFLPFSLSSPTQVVFVSLV